MKKIIKLIKEIRVLIRELIMIPAWRFVAIWLIGLVIAVAFLVGKLAPHGFF